jgi:YggT family protein
MFDQIAQFLIRTAFELFIYVVLMRFWMHALRAPFRNPIGQFVVALTDWAVAPLRRVVPPFRNYDLASFVVAWAAAIAMMFVLSVVLAGGMLAPALVLIGSLAALIRYTLHLLVIVVIVQVLFSWFNPGSELAYVFDGLTRPFYSFFRRFVPPIGGVDISPLFVVVIAQILLFVLDRAPLAFLTSGG